MSGKAELEKIRTVGVIAHGGAGKTTLVEAMLFDTGETTRLGKVDDGTSIMDFEPEEISRKTTLSAAFNSFNWAKHHINVIDTPGDFNFLGDTKTTLQGADSALVVIDAIDGVKVQTEKVWEFADEFALPRIIFVNKMDRERADFKKVVNEIREVFGSNAIPVHLPIGAEDNFRGVIDLLSEKAYFYNADESGKYKEDAIPSELQDDVATYKEELIEVIAESSDELLEKYLEGEGLSPEELEEGLRMGTINGNIVPISCGAAGKNMGVQTLLDLMVACLPSPVDRGPKKGKDPRTGDEIERAPDPDEPFSALVIKTITDPYAGKLSIFRIFSGTLGEDSTVYNSTRDVKERFGQLLKIKGKTQKSISEAGPGEIVAVAKLKETVTGDTLCDEKAPIVYESTELMPTIIEFAVEPKSKGDEEKIFSSLARLQEEDLTLKVYRDEQTKEMIIAGMGEIHIEATVDKLKRKFGVEVNLRTPKVPYKETIKGKARVQGKYKKQSGGRGQYGDCWIVLEPLPRGGGFEFIDKIVGGVIPKQFIPAVEKGILGAMEEGVLAGYPVVDVKVELVDGSFHSVDSSEMAFKIAGSMAFKKGALEAKPTILEPIMYMEIVVPDECMGDIIGDLNARRGKVLGMDSKGKHQVIKAHVPLAEVLRYAPDLRSITAGRGMFTMKFSHYEEVPAQLQEAIIEEARKEKEGSS